MEFYGRLYVSKWAYNVRRIRDAVGSKQAVPDCHFSGDGTPRKGAGLLVYPYSSATDPAFADRGPERCDRETERSYLGDNLEGDERLRSAQLHLPGLLGT